jgi:hypothetical protein
MSWFTKDQSNKENKPEYVKCKTCKHYIDKPDAQAVQVSTNGEYEYYCPMHFVNYDRRLLTNVRCLDKKCKLNHAVSYFDDDVKFHEVMRYYKLNDPYREVNKDGSEIRVKTK